jgi:hypothetical protein
MPYVEINTQTTIYTHSHVNRYVFPSSLPRPDEMAKENAGEIISCTDLALNPLVLISSHPSARSCSPSRPDHLSVVLIS